MTRVLVVATSRKTRGGITAVVKAHESGEQWKKYHCRWIETHRDGPAWRKIWYFVTALIEYIILLPFYDMVHIHVASYSSLKRKRYFLNIARYLNKKIIVHFHPHKPEVIFEKRTQKDYINFFKKADKIVALSPQWVRWIEEALDIHENVTYIFNPCPHVQRMEKLQKLHILFAGTLIKRKGYDILLHAFGKIAKEFPNWKLVIAGNASLLKGIDEMKNAKDIAEQFGITQQVDFMGWVEGKEKEKVFQEASIYCLASEGEGFPMAVLDAWAYGLPCVVTPVGGLPDIVVDGKNALVFNYGDIDGLKEKLELIIRDVELRKSIAKESLLLAQTTFNINTINKQISELYESVINGK